MDSRLVLRQVREEDRWRLWTWRNSERIRRVSTTDAEIPRESHDAWFTAHLPDMRDRTIIAEVDGAPVGWYQIEHWDPKNRIGEWGVALGEPSPIRGLGRAMPVLAHAHAFLRLQATELTGRVLAINERMMPVMDALGIPRAPTLDRDIERGSGETIALLAYRVSAEQWPQVWERATASLTTEVNALVRRVAESRVSE
jgi:RimJ/RimL family protein N-acetyltransferase